MTLIFGNHVDARAAVDDDIVDAIVADLYSNERHNFVDDGRRCDSCGIIELGWRMKSIGDSIPHKRAQRREQMEQIAEGDLKFAIM